MIPLMKLIAGCFCGLLSFFWILHVIVYVLVRPDGKAATLFLNDMLISIESAGVFVVSALFFFLLNLHLIFCVIKGCLKVGMRCFCFTVHPMRAGKTPLNSIIFNAMLVLMTCCAVVQFSQQCFQDY